MTEGLKRLLRDLSGWTGARKSIRCVLSISKEPSWESGTSRMEVRVWRSWATGLVSVASTVTAFAVNIEVPHGPVVDSQIDRRFVVHAINPKQLDRLRDRFSVAGAKDDRRDSYVMADSVRTDRRLFRRLHVADPRLVELRACSRLAEELTEELVRLGNRFHRELRRYARSCEEMLRETARREFCRGAWRAKLSQVRSVRCRRLGFASYYRPHEYRR